MNEPADWRLIVESGGGGGAWNMALDEALLDSYADSEIPRAPTLRLYGFRPATLSLGRLQNAGSSHSAEFLRDSAIDLVRRPTGGNAVLHDRERTYAVVGQMRRGPFGGRVVETYRQIAVCLAAALEALGVEVELGSEVPRESAAARREAAACFGLLSSYEITSGGRKLVGSAQLRRRQAFLQHGSIPLRSDLRLLEEALGRSTPAHRFTDLESAAGRPVETDRLDDAIVAAFEREFRTRLVPGSLTPAEATRATRLHAWKYCSAAWTYRGRLGLRESARVNLGSGRT